MLAKTMSVAVLGLQTHTVEVEAVVTTGVPRFDIVGLPDAAVSESRDRVRCALKSSNLKYPDGRITVNLAPADLKKEGPSFDLPIALAIAAATDQLPPEALAGVAALGELSLDGRVRTVPGVLPAAIHQHRTGDGRALLVPSANLAEARHVEEQPLLPVSTLAEAIEVLKEGATPVRGGAAMPPTDPVESPCDLSDVRGQSFACRAMEVLAAGGHNGLLVGPPGSGKSMLASCLPGLMPPLTRPDALEVTQIYSVARALPPDVGIVRHPPFRAPHHSCSPAGLVGGGSHPRPGEISLAHCGVLFLDEALEFPRIVLETLRQPLESGHITLSRAQLSVRFPARIMLLLALNPCPCGHLGDSGQPCACSPHAVERYRSRLSGPLLDRIDLHVEVARRNLADREALERGPSSASTRRGIEAARERQLGRNGGILNARMGARDVQRHCRVEPASAALLATSAERLAWSHRTHQRVLRLARTIADLAGAPRILDEHVEEAIALRRASFTESRDLTGIARGA